MLAPLKTSRWIEFGLATLISCLALVVYIQTLCPTIDFIDSGELAAVTYTLGIAHPTGYPLFTLVGHIFSHLPLGLRVIYQMNLMSAIFCAGGIFIFFYLLVFVMREIADQKLARAEHARSNFKREIWFVFLPSIVGATTLAFSQTYWSQALSVEVYSLHVFFLVSLVLIFIKTLLTTKSRVHVTNEGGRKLALRQWYLFAYVLGLAFTNHLTTILLAPAFLLAFFANWEWRQRQTWSLLARMAPFFCLGLSVYLYLPIRSAASPIMNWGHPVDLDSFFTHVSGNVYRVWLFSSSNVAWSQLGTFITELPEKFAYFMIVLAAVGLGGLWTRHRSGAIFSLLLFTSCVAYSINYDIHDIDSYFLLAYVVVALWSGIGVAVLLEIARSTSMRILVLLISLAGTAFLIVLNFSRVDESQSTMVETYANDMLRSVAPNGLVLTYQWDYFVSAALYLQHVEGVRTDVVIVDKELLRRSWYLHQLRYTYPTMMEGSAVESKMYESELVKFEHNIPYNPATIEYRYAAFINSMLKRGLEERPVYATPEIEDSYTVGLQRVPSGLAFRLYADTTRHYSNLIRFDLSVPPRINKYTRALVGIYSQALVNHALYADRSGRPDIAREALGQALSIDPHVGEVSALKAKYGL